MPNSVFCNADRLRFLLAFASVFVSIITCSTSVFAQVNTAPLPENRALARAEKASLDVDGSILKIANMGRARTLDPHRITSAWEARIVGDLFLGLVTEGPDASIVPGVATHWQQSDDQLVWTFTLRKSSWSDATPLTADDFVYSFRRALDPSTEAFFAPGLYAIKNARDFHSRRLQDPESLGIKAIDEQTLQITLNSVNAFFLEQLTHPIAYPVQKRQVESMKNEADTNLVAKIGLDFGLSADSHVEHPIAHKTPSVVSNGAYRLQAWRDDGTVELTRNLAFYDADEVHIGAVQFDPELDLDIAVEKFESGEVHIARDIGAADLAQMRSDREDETFVTPYLGVYYFALNMAFRPFREKTVRRALAMTVDRETITDKVLRTGETPAYRLVPPGVNDNDDVSVEWQFLSYEDRVVEARKLMEEAGYGPDNPLKFMLNYSEGDDTHERIVLAVTTMWKMIHVTAAVSSRAPSRHYELLQAGRFHAGRASWISQHNDASSFLGILHSRVGNLNYGGFRNKEFDSLLQRAARMDMGNERQNLFSRAEKILIDEQPVIPIYHYVSRNLVSRNIKGWQANTKDVQRTRYLSLADSE